ncbi:Hypothetical predicted protein [Mytilus galloprovincialis]|uniref:Uncharacterized protein n=1 Tax=Mytilus galloprovincialis TaxID=29158 RepID=A0A8B6FSW1_MYTGA|nr:Hypothetical predicted protein [Mytilus galloprovincialis]
MAELHNVNEVLEFEKRKLQDDYDRQIYEDLYRKSEAATAATKKFLDELKKEAESISELNVWKDIENMRVAYQYEKEEYFLCENIDEANGYQTGNEQDDVDDEIFDEFRNDQNETDKKPDEKGHENDDKSQLQKKEAVTETENQDFRQNDVVPIVSNDNSWWIASENVLPEVLPEIKEEKTSGVKYIFTTRPYSEIAHIHQRDKPIWLDIDLKKEIVLGEPDENEKKAMELEEKKMGKETRTSNLIYNGKNRKQKEEENENKKKRRTEIHNILNYGTKKRQTKEDKLTKSKQTKGEPRMTKKHIFQDFINLLFSCFRKTKPEEEL